MKVVAERLRKDPELFAKVVLGVDLWSGQKEILRAIAQHRRVAVKSCHASGKTYAIAVAVLWWVIAHEDGIVVTTAPTWTQVEKLIWGEIHHLVANVRRKGRIIISAPNKTELMLGPSNYALGLSTDDSTRFQGFHSGNVLVVVDEAPGVRDEIYQAIEGISAGGNVHVLALGNPVYNGGPFYNAFTSDRARWKTITIDAFDTPNLQGLNLEQLRMLPPDLPETDSMFTVGPRPYLVTRRWIYESFLKYGESSPFWQARVRGQFPDQAEDALISLTWLEAARKAQIPTDNNYDLEAGVDVAGPGDDECVVYVRRGPHIIAMQAWAQPDPRGAVLAFLAPYKSRLISVNVDAIGIGYNFGLHLRDQGLPVNLVNVGESARDNPERFQNRKAELFWALRVRFERGEIGGLTDDSTLSQLATIRYQNTPQGRVKIESKEDARARGVRSPDRAEALMLAFSQTRPGISEFTLQQALQDRQEEELNRTGRVPVGTPAGPAKQQKNRLMEIYERARRKIDGDDWNGGGNGSAVF